ncbi:SIMPL domain-containing protein [Schlesneria paludicola]|uniref:SIMPL domain-containing protein n=1 Tax=Schlesneria paludicola TaxID=360056 RepID=UPI00029B26F8|nr:SIMPL domain-containing protein [Schlesneria paludicola]
MREIRDVSWREISNRCVDCGGSQTIATSYGLDTGPILDMCPTPVIRRGVLFVASFVALLSAATLPLFAQNDPQGIVVEGTGEVRSVPNIVEINLRLSAKGELTDDAVVKHRDSKKRAIETFKALNLENLELEEKNLGLKAGGNMQEMMQMMWNGMTPAANKRTQVEVGSTLRARLVGVDKMPTEELMSTVGKLLDAAQDSGAGLGMSDADMMMMRYYGWGRQQQTSLVKFIVTNIKETREKAYDLAVKDARKRAERLARLSSVKLGQVLAIDEMGGNSNRNPYYYNPFESNDDKDDKDEIVAETMSGGNLKISLRVRFAILPGTGEPMQEAAAVEVKK